MTSAPPARIFLFPAKRSSRVAVLRRKPSKLWHLMVWDTKTDVIDNGSWFRGTLYPDRCDISWNGRWFVYNALDSRGAESWSGICQLPFLKTVFEWDNPGDYGGGGCWIEEDTLLLDPLPNGVGEHRDKVIKLGKRDCRLTVPETYATRAGDARLIRDGWIGDGPVWENRVRKSLPALRLTIAREKRTLSMEGSTLFDEPVTDACWDSNGQLLIARGGVLERYRQEDILSGKCTARIDLEALTAPKLGC